MDSLCVEETDSDLDGNNVEIYANSSLARGSLSDTIIGDGSKLDAIVHVAHNLIIGRNCELIASTIIGGSTTIADTSCMELNCTLKNKISIGSRVIVGCGAAVINDVSDEDIVAAKLNKQRMEAMKTEVFQNTFESYCFLLL
jgi:UDP-3-O-[3-hydroxymyristoyl] glucosamine N-acyltransferase